MDILLDVQDINGRKRYYRKQSACIECYIRRCGKWSYVSWQKIVKPEDPENVYPRSQYKADDSKIHYEERDVARCWKKHGVIISIVGLESVMPLMK
jgi:hypothetical protein